MMNCYSTFDSAKVEHDSIRKTTILTNIYYAKLNNYSKEEFMMLNKDPYVKRNIMIYWDNVAV